MENFITRVAIKYYEKIIKGRVQVPLEDEYFQVNTKEKSKKGYWKKLEKDLPQ